MITTDKISNNTRFPMHISFLPSTHAFSFLIQGIVTESSPLRVILVLAMTSQKNFNRGSPRQSACGVSGGPHPRLLDRFCTESSREEN